MNEMNVYLIINTETGDWVGRASSDPNEVWNHMKEIESTTWYGGLAVIETTIPFDLIGELLDEAVHAERDTKDVIDLIMPINWEEAVWEPEGWAGDPEPPEVPEHIKKLDPLYNEGGE